MAKYIGFLVLLVMFALPAQAQVTTPFTDEQRDALIVELQQKVAELLVQLDELIERENAEQKSVERTARLEANELEEHEELCADLQDEVSDTQLAYYQAREEQQNTANEMRQTTNTFDISLYLRRSDPEVYAREDAYHLAQTEYNRECL